MTRIMQGDMMTLEVDVTVDAVGRRCYENRGEGGWVVLSPTEDAENAESVGKF